MPVNLTPAVYSRINAELCEMGRIYWSKIPLDKMFGLLEERGLVAIQEDCTKWSGFFCGREGRAVITVADQITVKDHGDFLTYEPSKRTLTICWYQMPVTKTYEVTAYVS